MHLVEFIGIDLKLFDKKKERILSRTIEEKIFPRALLCLLLYYSYMERKLLKEMYIRICIYYIKSFCCSQSYIIYISIK